MCWAACDRVAKIAAVIGEHTAASRWRIEADRLRETILDASLLLLQEIGLVAASDPRFVATVDAVERALKRGQQSLRYATAGDFGNPTTAFNICTFWRIDALHAIGRRGKAREIYEMLLARRNRFGLLSEDIDPDSGALWGNFPQTCSMVGLIVSAMRLSRGWEEAFWRGS
jgi:GH15 family glucan-1,4-alpha-glucosidase